MDAPGTPLKTPARSAMAASNGVAKLRAIDRVTRAYHGVGRQRIEVPEWADDESQPLELFIEPLSQADFEAIYAANPTMTGFEETVRLIIRKTRDDQGNPLFDARDLHALMHECHSAILTRIRTAIMAASTPKTVDEAKQILGEDTALAFRMMIADRLNKSLGEVTEWPMAHLLLWSAYCSLNPVKAGEAPSQL